MEIENVSRSSPSNHFKNRGTQVFERIWIPFKDIRKSEAKARCEMMIKLINQIGFLLTVIRGSFGDRKRRYYSSRRIHKQKQLVVRYFQEKAIH